MWFGFGRAKVGARVKKVVWACLLGWCAVAFVGTSARGQTAVDGAISGFVLDATGAAVVGAVVHLEDAANGFVASATTESKGEFVVSHLPAGEYRVVIEYERFAKLTLEPVIVEIGGVTSVEARLKVGGVVSSVNVTGVPEEPATVATASVIAHDEIGRLAVNGRRWQTFALLTPTVHADPDGDGLLSFRGVASTQNSSRIDGGDDDQSFGSVPRGTGGESAAEIEDAAETGSSRRVGAGSVDGGGGYGRHAGAAYTFSQEAVREFRVSGQNYSALYGHAAGGIITTISKSGTNALHGTGFYLVRSSALGATNPFSIATTYIDGVSTSDAVKPHDLRQQFGGSVGGAVVQDKLFYFYAYDQQRRSFPAISTPDDPNFYLLTPTQSALLGNRGVTPSKGNAALNYLDSLTGTVARRQDQTINFGKVDWQASERHRLSVQYDRARSSSPSGVRSAPVVDLGTASMGSSYAKIDSLLRRWMWRASSSLSHELRIQYGRDFQYEEAPKPLPQEPAVAPDGFAPKIAIGPDGFTFGTSTSLGRTAYPDEKKVQLADLATWVKGRHQFQIGWMSALFTMRLRASATCREHFITTVEQPPVMREGWWTGSRITPSMCMLLRMAGVRRSLPRCMILLSVFYAKLWTAGSDVRYAGVGGVRPG
jgi:hypothetical protein